MRGREPNLERRAAVKALALEGRKARDIAKALGVTITSVKYYMHDMLANGEIPRIRERRGRHEGSKALARRLCEYHEVELGGMAMLVAALSDAQRTWLFEQVPRGGKVSELIAAIVVDAYNDENGEEK